MSATDWNVVMQGYDEALKKLQAFEQPALDRKLKKGVQSGARVYRKAIQRGAPARVKAGVDPGFGRNSSAKRGGLYKSIKSKTLRGSPPAAVAGPTSRYRHLAINATKPHRIAALSLRGGLAIGGNRFARVVHHPGNQPHPWVGAAVAGSRGAGLEAMRKAIVKEVEEAE